MAKSLLFDKILLPTDGSDHSLKAAKYTAELAKICGSEVTLLYVLETEISERPVEVTADSWISPMRTEKKIKEMAQEVIDKAKEVFEEAGTPVEAKFFIDGHPSRAILDTAEKEGIDLIIMGSQGLGPMKRLMLGSVADRVCNLAPCPVFIVR